MPVTPRRSIPLILICFTAAAGLTRFSCFRHSDQAVEHETMPDSARSESADVSFSGSQACRACHARQFESWQQTAHSRAMALIDAAAEPGDARLTHAASGRSYQVLNLGGTIWHVERSATESSDEEDDSPVETAESPRSATMSELRHSIRYRIGSGHHSRTYLIESDGFLCESPLTWYASTSRWDMSPGYDQQYHAGFERVVDAGCLTCHTGQVVEKTSHSVGQISLTELAIGCERCHGSGADHVEFHRTHPEGGGADGDRMIHPGRLSRDLATDLCAQCHLRGDATVLRAGQSLDRFRPGRPLSDVRVDYQLVSDGRPMTVVGHVDQMLASPCYQQSTTLTCITCHDPHHNDPDQSPRSLMKAQCVQCHATSGCGLSPQERLVQQPADDCLACHMPQVTTDIPHIAFTHHRIGRHQQPDVPTASIPVHRSLRPVQDVSHLSAAEQQRCLGLAWAELGSRTGDSDVKEFCRSEAVRLLRETVQSGEADGEVLAVLSRLYWEDRFDQQAAVLAQAAIGQPDLSANSRAGCLSVLAQGCLESGDAAAALPLLRELVSNRRNSQDWLLLALAESRTGDGAAAIASARTGIEIQPFRPDLHMLLADLLDTVGNTAEATVHRSIADRLSNRR